MIDMDTKILPLVTVGIPVFNGARFVKSAVMSVLKQTYPHFELIITDDGSSDNTVDIIRLLKDERIRLVADGVNRGISYRLNQQIDMAKGEIFVRMDADDLMFPHRIEEQVKYLQMHPDVDVVGSLAVVIDDENEILGMRGGNKIDYTLQKLFFSTRFIHPTVAGRTAWFRKWKYRESVSGCEDRDLWIRSFNKSKFADIDAPLMFYRDPLQFKLRTYLYRQRKILRNSYMLRKYAGYSVLMSCIIKSIVSSSAACLLCILGKDKKMISRRNVEISDNEVLNYYKAILIELK